MEYKYHSNMGDEAFTGAITGAIVGAIAGGVGATVATF